LKVAFLIDGGFFLKRFHALFPGVDRHDADKVVQRIKSLIENHLDYFNKVQNRPNPWSLLYRSFYYDARPYEKQGQYPISRRPINYARSPDAIFRRELFRELRKTPNMALRLGEVRKDSQRSWIISPRAQNDLLARKRTPDQLTDDDFAPALRQKGVDMRLGIDMASLCLKRQADTIVLVAGDSDFVPAAKMARREGVRVILDPLWQNVSDSLFEHIDGLYSGARKPGGDETGDE